MKLTRILNQTKQTFFECFNLKPSFKIDKSSLHSSYISLQKKYHPDNVASQSQTIQKEYLDKSTLINNAYKTLSNNKNKINYLLELKNLNLNQTKLSPTETEELFELNELIAFKQLHNDDTKIIKYSIELVISELENEFDISYSNNNFEYCIKLKQLLDFHYNMINKLNN